jgi:hypothetical protein
LRIVTQVIACFVQPLNSELIAEFTAEFVAKFSAAHFHPAFEACG